MTQGPRCACPGADARLPDTGLPARGVGWGHPKPWLTNGVEAGSETHRHPASQASVLKGTELG